MKNTLYFTLIEDDRDILGALSDYSTLFPVDIQKRWGWHLDFDDKINSIVSKLLLYMALRRSYPDANPVDFPLQYHRTGRPFIEKVDFDFNISHSHQLIACAVNYEGRIGIDVQYKRQKRDFLKFKKALRGLSPDDRIHTLADWAALEAKVKCAGGGLRDMQQVLTNAQQYSLKIIHLNEDYLCRVASYQPLQLNIRNISSEELLFSIQQQFSSLKKQRKYGNYSLSQA